jgi:hypothetical protein
MTSQTPDKQPQSFSVLVDDDLQRAEEGAFQLLYHQRQQFNQRWQQQHTIVKYVKTVGRWLAQGLTVAGFVLCLASLISGHTWSGSWWPLALCLVVFFLIGLLAYRLPDLEPAIDRWSDGVSRNSCRKVARRCVKGADQRLPFTAGYGLKADQVTYHRDQEQAGEAIWTRAVSGHALVADELTILIKKPRSLHPRVVILLPPTAEWLRCLDAGNVGYGRRKYG